MQVRSPGWEDPPGEGNGNPLQCSCLGNPRAGGAWWAAVYGVAQSRTRLKRLSSKITYPRRKICMTICIFIFIRLIQQFISYYLHYLLLNFLSAAAKSLQSCLTLCDPIDGSPPGSPGPGILQARTLEWVAISFSNA